MHVTLNGFAACKMDNEVICLNFIHNKEEGLLLTKVFAIAGVDETQFNFCNSIVLQFRLTLRY